MRQQTLAAQTGFERYGRKSKREQFLDEMELVVPWGELEALVEPHYPKGENGRPPIGLSIMLRVYFLQQWFNLSDPGAEESLYESPVLRRFAGVDLGRAPAPDESTILQFRHLLERHDLGGAMLQAVNEYLERRDIRISRGTIVDATILHAPSSTKNRSGERDPEMHQTRKGKQWYFGLKARCTRISDTLRLRHCQPFAVHVQIHQRKAGAQPLMVLLQPAISHLLETEDALQVRNGCSTFARTRAFTPELAKHSKPFSLIDCISVGVDRMQRSFEPMRKLVEAWQRSEVTDVTAKVVILRDVRRGKLEAPKHLARAVHDLYLEPKYEEFRPRTIWSLLNAFTSAFKELDPIPQFQGYGEAG